MITNTSVEETSLIKETNDKIIATTKEMLNEGFTTTELATVIQHSNERKNMPKADDLEKDFEIIPKETATTTATSSLYDFGGKMFNALKNIPSAMIGDPGSKAAFTNLWSTKSSETTTATPTTDTKTTLLQDVLTLI